MNTETITAQQKLDDLAKERGYESYNDFLDIVDDPEYVTQFFLSFGQWCAERGWEGAVEMGKYEVKLKQEALLPTIEVYKDYFDRKYPCTTEENCGDNMPPEDKEKFSIYNYLLSVYENPATPTKDQFINDLFTDKTKEDE